MLEFPTEPRHFCEICRCIPTSRVSMATMIDVSSKGDICSQGFFVSVRRTETSRGLPYLGNLQVDGRTALSKPVDNNAADLEIHEKTSCYQSPSSYCLLR